MNITMLSGLKQHCAGHFILPASLSLLLQLLVLIPCMCIQCDSACLLSNLEVYIRCRHEACPHSAQQHRLANVQKQHWHASVAAKGLVMPGGHSAKLVGRSVQQAATRTCPLISAWKMPCIMGLAAASGRQQHGDAL